jgi:hypothetical protein
LLARYFERMRAIVERHGGSRWFRRASRLTRVGERLVVIRFMVSSGLVHRVVEG